MAVNTKARSQAIFAAALAAVRGFDIERLDALPPIAAAKQRQVLARLVAEATGCHRETARLAVAKACRQLRHGDQPADGWGGSRPGAGRPVKDNNE